MKKITMKGSFMNTRIDTFRRILQIVLFSYIGLYSLGIVLIDILNVFGSQRIMEWYTTTGDFQKHKVPLLWFALKAQGGFTEIMQWSYLFVGTVTVATMAYCMRKWHVSGQRWFFVWTLAMVVLFAEDTLNTRHWLRHVITRAIYGTPLVTHTVGSLIEIVSYGLMAVLMILPPLMLWRIVTKNKKTLRWLLVGYASYAVASFFSATRHVFEWYMKTGDALLRWTGLIRLPNWAAANETIITGDLEHAEMARTLGFYFMDYVVEETLELLGAGLLAIAFLMLFRDVSRSFAARTKKLSAQTGAISEPSQT